MKFQSPIIGFKGLHLDSSSTKESLIHTAALRVLCQMLREPLFNQLRTKEQLGYIVNSHYDLDFASQQAIGSFETIPINSIVVNVLSRKVPPHMITQRIDEFLDSFRQKLG
jgi:secreted Zn-dependent insulinase-like peptidase